MPEVHYLALLRGINVGGSNIMRMTDLKSCLEGLGVDEVTTYIQSGNVLFKADGPDRKNLNMRIEQALSKRFKYKSRVVLITQRQLSKVIDNAPRGFGTSPDKYRYDVIFLKEPMTSKEAMKSVPLKEGVDTVKAGKDVLYFSRLSAKASQSRLARIASLPVYQFMTIRNWNTTTKLLNLMNVNA